VSNIRLSGKKKIFYEVMQTFSNTDRSSLFITEEYGPIFGNWTPKSAKLLRDGSNPDLSFIYTAPEDDIAYKIYRVDIFKDLIRRLVYTKLTFSSEK